MPVLYYTVEEQTSLAREPYKTLTRKFRNIRNALDSKEIEIDIGSEEEGFANGFYTDSYFTNNARLRFIFSKVDGNSANKLPGVFIRMLYSFECNDNNLQYYRKQIGLLKKRIPYFYIPNVSHLSFSSQIDDEFSLWFDVLVDNENNVLQVCYSLLNQLIAILAFED